MGPAPTDTLPANSAAGNEFHARFSRRLQFFTLGIGFSAAIAAAFIRSPRTGFGVASGAVLAWLNYRWLEGGLGALIGAATRQAGLPKPKVPASVYIKFAGRYALIGLIVYGIVSYLRIPLPAVMCGLLALGAAAIAEGLYQILTGFDR